MVLLFLTPVGELQPIYFDVVPARSIVHCFLFWGFVHIWIGACKKQLKYEFIRRKAFFFVFIAALILALISEITMVLFNVSPGISYWNLLFDLVGSGLGMLTFRVLYASCY
jgi:hypothetical protein